MRVSRVQQPFMVRLFVALRAGTRLTANLARCGARTEGGSERQFGYGIRSLLSTVLRSEGQAPVPSFDKLRTN